MLRRRFGAWEAAFSERRDGDLRVSARGPGEAVEDVQRRALAVLGVSAVVVARQVHGADIVAVGGPASGYTVGVGEGDGVVTALAGVAVAVHVADCVPVAIGGEGGVAMLHCGWRGLAGGIVEQGVRALRAIGATGELQSAIGPGVGGCCYETGDEVRGRFAGYGAADGRLLDLKTVAAAQLRSAGVMVIEDVGLCTICAASGRLFSHRRDGERTGRQGGFAWLR